MNDIGNYTEIACFDAAFYAFAGLPFLQLRCWFDGDAASSIDYVNYPGIASRRSAALTAL